MNSLSHYIDIPAANDPTGPIDPVAPVAPVTRAAPAVRRVGLRARLQRWALLRPQLRSGLLVALVCGAGALTGCADEMEDLLLKAEGIDLHAPALTEAQRTSAAQLHRFCQVTTPMATSQSLGELHVDNNRTVYSIGRNPASSRRYQTTHVGMTPDEAFDEDGLLLVISSQDLRQRTQPFPGVLSESSSNQRMGVLFPSALADNHVGCVVHAHSFGTVQGRSSAGVTSSTAGNTATPTWNSFQLGSVPVEQLQGTPIDGLEFVANFQPVLPGQTFFTVPKTALRSPESVSICSYTVRGAMWQCAVPKRQDTASHWVFVLDKALAGVHVLVSTQTQRGA